MLPFPANTLRRPLQQLYPPTQSFKDPLSFRPTYSLVLPVQVKGKLLESVADTGAQVTIINSKLIDLSQLEAEQVVLRGLEPNKPIDGHLVKDVAINLGGGCIGGICMSHLSRMISLWGWIL